MAPVHNERNIFKRAIDKVKSTGYAIGMGAAIVSPAESLNNPIIDIDSLNQNSAHVQIGESLGTKSLSEAVESFLDLTTSKIGAQEGTPYIRPLDQSRLIWIPVAERQVNTGATPVPTAEPTKTPEVSTITLEQWYLKAQEVPGTRLTKTVNGKECLLRSIVEPSAVYEFRWRDNFPESLAKVVNFMAEDEINRGYDELVIGSFSSIDTAPKNIPFSEVRERQADGSFRSRGYFAHIVFEINGKEVRMAAYAPPKGTITFDNFFIGGASGSTATELIYTSIAGDKPVSEMTSEERARSQQVGQDYINIVKISTR